MVLLSSSRTNDEISSEIAELVGFDQIELVMDLLGSRRSVAKEVSTFAFMLPYSCIIYSIALSSLGLEKKERGKRHRFSVVQ